MAGTYYNTVILTSPNYGTQNPFTVGTAGLVSVTSGDGIVGTAGYAWTVFNRGTIESSAGDGIDLTLGGVVTNGTSGSSGGLISGSSNGVEIDTGTGTVVNFGSIAGGSHGIVLGNGGTVANFGTVTGVIYAVGAAAVLVTNSGVIAGGIDASVAAAAMATNSGMISGGIALAAVSNTVTNTSTISSTGIGVGVGAGIDIGTDLVTNSGMIGAGESGVYFNAAESGTLANTGTITAAIGVFSRAGQTTVTNSGVITASSGTGVVANVVTNASAGRITGLTGVYVSTLANYGRIVGNTGAGVALANDAATVMNAGTISGPGVTGMLFSTSVAATVGQTVVDTGTIAGRYAVQFGSGADVLVLGTASALTGTLAGFGVNDTIDLAKVQATGATFSSGTLTVMNGTAVVESLVLAGAFTANGFALSPDGQGGVDINIRQPLGNIIGGTYGNTIVLTAPNANTTVISTGRITAPSGPGIVNAVGVVGTLTNMGHVTATGSGGQGIYLGAGGIVTNSVSGSSGGYISGAAAGVLIGGGPGTVTNSGTVKGGMGVAAASGANLTVTNSGTIVSTAGTAGTAVALAGGTSRLIVDPGAVFTGIVDGGGGASVLEIAAAGSGGSGPGRGQGSVAYVSLGSVTNFSALQIDPSATLDSLGALSFDTLINQGQVVVASGDSLALGNVADAANTGVIDLRTGAMVDFEGSVGNQILEFDPAGGTAAIDQPAAFGATITDFAPADTIDLTGLAFVPGYTPTLSGTTLTVTNGTTTDTLTLTGVAAGALFAAAPDAGGGTDVTVACFCRGTLILTDRGEVTVEVLAIGDRPMTISGAAKPIRWIGRRSYGARFIAGNRAVLPIRIAAGAIAAGMPARDLWVSPEHALWIPGSSPGTGALVPARQLVNGASVVQAEAVGQVDYFHIELEAHEIIFADGMPAETFVDCGNRFMFHNAGEFAALYPDDRRPAWQFCAKRLEEGSAELAMIRAALLARAEALGYRLTDDPDLRLIVDGEVVRAEAVEEAVYRFTIPAGGHAVWLASRSAVPAEVEPSSQDRRRLGVPLKEIVLRGAGLCTEIGHGHSNLHQGFHDAEDGHRWTDGSARLPDELLRLFAGEVTVEVHLIKPGLRYLLNATAGAAEVTVHTGPARPARPRRRQRATAASV